LPVAGLARFCRRVRVQDNRPRASKWRASGVRAEREQHAGGATRRDDPAGSYAGVPAVFQWHMCVSRGSSKREQEDPEVRGGVSLANQSGPIGFFRESTTSSNSYSSPIVRARSRHLEETPEPPSSFFDPCVPKHHRRGKADCCRHGPP
jgi:hypothetical protein